MSRFTNLEFEDSSAKQKKPETKSIRSEEARDYTYYLKQAHEFFQQGQFEKALRSYSRTLEFSPNVFDAWFGQVQMLIELHEFLEADTWANKALEKYADHPKLVAARAITQARMGNLSKAMAFSDFSIKASGLNPYIWLARGDVLLADGQKNYEYCFWKAIQENENKENWFVHIQIASSYQYYRRYAPAIKEFQKALEKNVGYSFWWIKLGQCQLEVGMNNSAINSFKRALELDPKCLEAKKNIEAAKQVGLLTQIKRFLTKFYT